MFHKKINISQRFLGCAVLREEQEGRSMKNKTIMIVEDEEETRRFLSNYLKRKKFRIIEAENGEEAFKKLEIEEPDLILLDVNMPKMSGFEFLKAIKSNPQRQHIPTIMLTIRKGAEDLDKGLMLGVDFYLPKPFTLENLAQFIELTVTDKGI